MALSYFCVIIIVIDIIITIIFTVYVYMYMVSQKNIAMNQVATVYRTKSV